MGRPAGLGLPFGGAGPLLLAAFLLSFSFLLAGAQSSGTITVTADPQKPIEGESVTLTPATIPANSIFCNWYRERAAEESKILLYYLPPISALTNGPMYTGRETVDTKCSLNIANLNVNDSGTYIVTVNGPGTTLTGSVDIVVSEVLSKPTLSISSNPFPRERIDSLELTCGTNATRANVIWLLDGKPVGNNSRVQFSDHNRTLTIQQVLRGDAGSYRCQVSNLAYNETSDAAHVPVVYGPDAPVITPNASTYYEHSEIGLKCVAESFPEPTYTWLFNGRTFGGGEDLIRPDVRRADSGNYTCRATNVLSYKMADTTLEIQVVGGIYNVTILGPPSVIEYEPVNLTCTSIGPNVTYHWLKDGQLIQTGGQILTLDTTTRDDAGLYTCFGNNSISSDYSEPHRLEVFYGPDKPIIEPSEQVYLEHSTLNLSCSANSYPYANYSWYYNGDLEKNSSQYVRGPISLGDAGNYTCNATNDLTGLSNSTTLVIRVLERVTNVVITSSPIKALENSVTALRCDSAGTDVSYFWLKGNQSLEVGERVSLSENNQVVTFNTTLRTDSDVYTCYANNTFSHSTGNYTLNVLYGPDEPVISPNTSYYETGSTLNLSCNADSNPPANYTWSFNNQRHEGSNLQIANLLSNNTGNYTCMASNGETGLNSSQVLEIWVWEPVSNVVITSAPIKVLEDSVTALRCDSTGTDVSYFWLKGDQSLEVGEHVSLSENNQVVTFNTTLRTDSDVYTCYANNTFSHSTGNYTLNVLYGPDEPVISPNTSYYETGSTLNLSCNADSNPPANYTWSFNNQRHEGSNLQIANLLSNNTGNYTCMASNGETGLNSSQVLEIWVLEPVSNVVITSAPIKVLEDSVTTLRCDSSGTDVSYFWLKGDQSLEVGERVSLSENNQVVTFNTTLRTDSGIYTCYVNNSISRSMANYTLNVLYGPDEPVISPNTSYYETGSTLNLSCNADSNPPANYTWFVNNQRHEGSNLQIPNLSFDNTGKYTCMASNAETGLNSSHVLEIWVLERLSKPTLRPPSYMPLENEDVLLECNTSSSPSVNVSWFKDGKPLQAANAVLSGNNRNLTIVNFTKADDGNYTCEASNAISTESSDPSVITMAYGPDQVKINQSGDISVALNSRLVLLCSADSNPAAQFRWFFNNSDTKVMEETFRVESVAWKDGGNYTCQAHNNRTNLTASASVFVKVTHEGCPGGCNPHLTPGEIAGIVIGCLAAVALIGGLVYYLCTKTSLGRTERHASNGNIPSAPGHNQGATDTKPRTGEEDIQYSTLAFNANSPPQPAPAAGQPLDTNIIYSEIKKK